MKITDLRCAIIGGNPVVRVTTDAGIDGYGQVDSLRPSLKQNVLFYKDLIVGQDPRDVERVMHRIRRYGAFKPWGTAVSVIEVALWDIAGKAADLPVHKLLGGKVRDRVRVYNGQVRFPMKGWDPKHWAENMQKMRELPEGFTIIKQGISFHSQTPQNVPDYFFGELHEGPRQRETGVLTQRGMKYTIACVEAMKEVLGDEVGLALDCGPGWTVPDAIRFAKAIEPYNIMWCEDTITGDYTPYVLADVYKQVTQATSTPIHTGEEIYLRQNFRELIEQKAVRILGPDPLDMGGIAELKWVAEYAALHGLLIAPHGVGAGLLGLAAHVQVGAAMPDNFIAFEYPTGNPQWWYDIVDGLPDPIVKQGFVDVWDKPGLGVTINPRKARKYLDSGDKDFFS